LEVASFISEEVGSKSDQQMRVSGGGGHFFVGCSIQITLIFSVTADKK